MEKAVLTDLQHEILSEGSALLSGYTNVAPGTPGGEVRKLIAAGLLERSPERFEGDPYAARYVITPTGRAALAEHARQALTALSPAK